MKKKVTLSIEKSIYDKFSSICKEKGLILSKQVEFFMKKKLKEEEDEE
jgi:hypothetical protein